MLNEGILILTSSLIIRLPFLIIPSKYSFSLSLILNSSPIYYTFYLSYSCNSFRSLCDRKYCLIELVVIFVRLNERKKQLGNCFPLTPLGAGDVGLLNCQVNEGNEC